MLRKSVEFKSFFKGRFFVDEMPRGKAKSTNIPRVPQCLSCPIVGIGTTPPPLPPSSVYCVPPPPPRTEGGGTHSPAGEGSGIVPIRMTEEKAWHSFYSVGYSGWPAMSKSQQSMGSFNPSILRRRVIWGAADEAILRKVLTLNKILQSLILHMYLRGRRVKSLRT